MRPLKDARVHLYWPLLAGYGVWRLAAYDRDEVVVLNLGGKMLARSVLGDRQGDNLPSRVVVWIMETREQGSGGEN